MEEQDLKVVLKKEVQLLKIKLISSLLFDLEGHLKIYENYFEKINWWDIKAKNYKWPVIQFVFLLIEQDYRELKYHHQELCAELEFVHSDYFDLF